MTTTANLVLMAIGLIVATVAGFRLGQIDLLKIKKDSTRKGYQNGWDAARLESQRSREIENEIRAENFMHVGGTVITIPNEWSDPVVGKIIGFLPNSESIPVILDDVSGEEKVCFGLALPYHPEMLAAILKLNPFERYSLAIGARAAGASCYIFDKKKTYEGSLIHQPASSSDEVASALRAKGYEV